MSRAPVAEDEARPRGTRLACEALRGRRAVAGPSSIVRRDLRLFGVTNSPRDVRLPDVQRPVEELDVAPAEPE